MSYSWPAETGHTKLTVKNSLKVIAIICNVFSSVLLPLIKKAPFGSVATGTTSASDAHNDTKEKKPTLTNEYREFLFLPE